MPKKLSNVCGAGGPRSERGGGGAEVKSELGGSPLEGMEVCGVLRDNAGAARHDALTGLDLRSKRTARGVVRGCRKAKT